ncbi:MAG: S8 family serine peptidase, partial [Terriglobales bacterium]
MQKSSHYLIRLLLAAAFCAGLAAQAPNYGVLTHLPAAAVAAFEARHTVQAVQLSPTRDLYLVTCNDGRSDAQLLQELLADPVAVRPVLNATVALGSDYQLSGTQSTASVLNGTQSTASVLNGTGSTSGGLSLNLGGGLLGGGLNFLIGPGTLLGGLVNGVLNPLLGSVLNLNISVGGTGSATASGSGSVLSSAPTYFYGAVVPQAYPQQSVLDQVHAGNYALADGHGVEIALIDNGVDPNNPVLSSSLDWQNGYNFYDGSRDWSAYADLGTTPASGSGLAGVQSTASVLNGQSTASVLNGEPCAGGFGSSGGLSGYQSTASVLNGGQSTASVLNGGQSTASVLNGDTSSASVLSDLALLLTCDPDFGHGTSVAGVLHLVAPRATILPIKAFGPGGSASAATIYQAIAYAIDRHVQVM